MFEKKMPMSVYKKRLVAEAKQAKDIIVHNNATIFYVASGAADGTPIQSDKERDVIFNTDVNTTKDVHIRPINSATVIKGKMAYQETSDQTLSTNESKTQFEKMENKNTRMVKTWHNVNFHSQLIYIVKIEEAGIDNTGKDNHTRYYHITRAIKNSKPISGEFESWTLQLDSINLYTQESGTINIIENGIAPGGILLEAGETLDDNIRDIYRGVAKVKIKLEKNFLMSDIIIKGTRQRGVAGATPITIPKTIPNSKLADMQQLDTIKAHPKVEAGGINWWSNWPAEYEKFWKNKELYSWSTNIGNVLNDETNKLITSKGKVRDIRKFNTEQNVNRENGIIENIYGNDNKDNKGSPFTYDTTKLTKVNSSNADQGLWVNGEINNVDIIAERVGQGGNMAPRHFMSTVKHKDYRKTKGKLFDIVFKAFSIVGQDLINPPRVNLVSYLGLSYNKYFKSLEHYQNFFDNIPATITDNLSKGQLNDGITNNFAPRPLTQEADTSSYMLLMPTNQNVFERVDAYKTAYGDALNADPALWNGEFIKFAIAFDLQTAGTDISQEIKNIVRNSVLFGNEEAWTSRQNDYWDIAHKWLETNNIFEFEFDLPYNAGQDPNGNQVNDGWQIQSIQINAQYNGIYDIRYYDRYGKEIASTPQMLSATAINPRTTNVKKEYYATN